MNKYENLITGKENEYLIDRFGKSFTDIMELSDEEKETVNETLMYDLENDNQDHEISLLANRVLIAWGRFEEGLKKDENIVREELIRDITDLCVGLSMALPEGFPKDMTNEDMEKWLGTWDEFDPYDVMEELSEPDPFILSEYEIPVCNHVKGLTRNNIGYVSGIMSDGVPFEAEKFEYSMEGEKYVDIAIILPELNRVSNKKVEKKNGNISGIKYEVACISNGILNIGMVDEGYEDDFGVIDFYLDYLIDRDVISFKTKLRNGSIQYCTDIRGTKLVYLTIGLTAQNEIQAYTYLQFKDFPIRKERTGYLNVIK